MYYWVRKKIVTVSNFFLLLLGFELESCTCRWSFYHLKWTTSLTSLNLFISISLVNHFKLIIIIINHTELKEFFLFKLCEKYIGKWCLLLVFLFSGIDNPCFYLTSLVIHSQSCIIGQLIEKRQNFAFLII